MVKEGKASLNNVTMASLSRTIMLGGVRRCGEMSNVMGGEKRFKFCVFSTTIRIQRNNFGVKVIFNKVFKGGKNCRDIRLVFKGVKPNIFSVMIDKNEIIEKTIN